MSREAQVRFCESRGVRFPPATHLIVHCVTQRQAHQVLAAIADRMAEVGLPLHPDKTKVVCCKDERRTGLYAQTSFTFLGYTFRPRKARRSNGGNFLAFLPAISKDALKKIGAEVRSWRLHRRVNSTFAGLATAINQVVAGWMHYHGRFYRSALHPLLIRINAYLVRWIRKKYKRLRRPRKASQCLRRITQQYPRMFAHWRWVAGAW